MGDYEDGFKAGLKAAAAESCGCISDNPEVGDGPVILTDVLCTRKGCGKTREEHAFGMFCP